MIPFRIPAVWAISVGFAVCLEAVALRSQRVNLVTLCLCFVSGVIGKPLMRMEPVSTLVDGYARNLLNQLPKDAVLFAGPDHAAFPIMYLQVVERVRPDVTLGNPYGYVDVALIAEAPAALRDDLERGPGVDLTRSISRGS